LEKQFEVKKYLSSSERAEMAKLLNVTETQVRTEKPVVSFGTGPGSSVGIATDYGLDGPGIESRWDEIFRTCPDRP
jgi:hypothetical protein